jgi:hypothetical protein
MSLPPSARDAERHRWRTLAQHALACASAPDDTKKTGLLAVAAAMAKDFALPTGERPEDLKCVALIHVAKAYVHQPSVKARLLVAPALRAVAELVGDLLDATDAPAPTRPWRADIDG